MTVRSKILSVVSILLTTAFSANETSQSGINSNFLNTEVRGSEAIAQEVKRFGQLLYEATNQAKIRLEQEGVRIEGKTLGIVSIPATLQDQLPFRWSGMEKPLPLDLLNAEAQNSDAVSSNGLIDLLDSFNVQLISGSISQNAWPSTTTLEMKIRRYDGQDSAVLDAQMVWDSGSSAYYFVDAFDTYQSLLQHVNELTPSDRTKQGRSYLPILEISRLSGFQEIGSEYEQSHFPRGVAVTHSIRLGNLRLGTGFSWIGRPKEILALFPERFLH